MTYDDIMYKHFTHSFPVQPTMQVALIRNKIYGTKSQAYRGHEIRNQHENNEFE